MAFSKLFSKLKNPSSSPSAFSRSGSFDEIKIKAKLVLNTPVFDESTASRVKSTVDTNGVPLTRRPTVLLTIAKDAVYLTQTDKTGYVDVLLDIPHCSQCQVTVSGKDKLLAIEYVDFMGPLSMIFLKIKPKRRFFWSRKPKMNSVGIKSLIEELRAEFREKQKKDRKVESAYNLVDDIDSIGECSLISNNSSEEFFNICRTDPEVDINSDALSDCSLISYQCTKDCNDPFKSSSPSSGANHYIGIEQLVEILNHMPVLPVQPVQSIEEKDCSVEDMIASILQDPL